VRRIFRFGANAITATLLLFLMHQTGWADAARGRALAEQVCAQCHGIGPEDASPDPDAPPFAEIAAERSVTEYSLRVFFRTSHRKMPNFILEPDETDDVIRYILSLRRGGH
jgi:mono/diheme cytochrome c family protein